MNYSLHLLTLLNVFGTQDARKDMVRCSPSNSPCPPPPTPQSESSRFEGQQMPREVVIKQRRSVP